MENILSGIINYNFFRVIFTLVFIVCFAVMGKGIVTEILPELLSAIKTKNKESVSYYSKILAVAVTCVLVSVYSTKLLLEKNVDTNNKYSLIKGV